MAPFKRLMCGACVAASLAAAAALPLAGCGTVGGTTMMTYNGGDTAPGMETVDEETEGWYALMPNNSGNATRRKKLAAGDQYGFEQRGGKVVGLVRKQDGEESVIPLEAKLATAYYWKWQKTAKD